jgi:hypothetical protein
MMLIIYAKIKRYPHSNMKKTHTNPQINSNLTTLSDTFADNPLVEWVSQNGRILLWTLAGILALSFFLYRILGSSSSEADYLYAEKEFITFQNSVNHKDDSARQTALGNLTAVLKKHPELQAKYDSLIAQGLINSDDIKGATFFADTTFDRISVENLSFYTDYAKTTLNISNQNYEEALKQALGLKQQMLDNASASFKEPNQKAFGDTLYAFNLLRIAILSQQVGDKGHELAAWQALQNTGPAKDSTAYMMTPESLEAVRRVFLEGKTSLQDYIQMRIKTLK